jgi:hypothetical protein
VKKVVYWSIGIIISILLLEILVFGSYGDKLKVTRIDVLYDTDTSSETVTCQQHYKEVLSTYTLYEAFIDDCKVTKELDYDSDYFLYNVLVVSNFYGDENETPRSFFDYYFSVNGKETIKVTYHKKIFSNGKDIWYWYLIEMSRNQIATEQLVIG